MLRLVAPAIVALAGPKLRPVVLAVPMLQLVQQAFVRLAIPVVLAVPKLRLVQQAFVRRAIPVVLAVPKLRLVEQAMVRLAIPVVLAVPKLRLMEQAFVEVVIPVVLSVPKLRLVEQAFVVKTVPMRRLVHPELRKLVSQNCPWVLLVELPMIKDLLVHQFDLERMAYWVVAKTC